MQGATLEIICPLGSRGGAKSAVTHPSPYQVNDSNSKTLGPVLGYRPLKTVRS